jgi:tRNA pseudouridine38-40 synthase
MNNIKIELSYDSTNYFGWQKTKAGPSIQSELEKAFGTVLQIKVKLQAASRTDKNVHAKKQIANIFLEKDIDLDLLTFKLNCLLPKDIRILKLEKVHIDFHPTLDAKKKEYRYYIYQNAFHSPILRFYSWHVHKTLDIEKMKTASKLLIGTKDFSSFTNRIEKNNVRTIFDIKIEKNENQIIISMIGDNFLYKMARIIVGTLVYVGLNKIPIEKVKQILDSKTRKHFGITAPAKGLFLHEIFYS